MEQLQPIEMTIMLLFDNYALGTEGASVAASSTAPGDLVVSNLLTPWLDEHWRSGSIKELQGEKFTPNTPTVTLQWALGQARAIDTVYLGRHNIRTSPLRVRFYQGPPSISSACFESAWTDPIIRGRLDEFTWTDLIWHLGPRESDLTTWQLTWDLDSLVIADQLYHGITHVELDIGSSPDQNRGVDYFQIGYPIVCRAFQPKVNVVLGWSFETVDRTEVLRTDAGEPTGRRRSIGKRLLFTLKYLKRQEAFARVFSAYCQRHGLSGRVFAWLEPGHPRWFYAQRILGTSVELPEVTMNVLDWPSATSWALETAA